MTDRGRMLPGGDQSGDVSDVGHEYGVHLVGDLAEPVELDSARICGRAADDDLGSMLPGKAAHLVVVYELQLAVHRVGHELVQLVGEVHGAAVCEMSAVVEAESHDRVAGLDGGEVGGHVGLRAGVGLHVGVIDAEELFGALDSQPFGHVNELASAVVAPSRVALGVLVGHHRPLRLQDGAAGVVLRGDEVYVLPLPADFAFDGFRNLRVGLS